MTADSTNTNGASNGANGHSQLPTEEDMTLLQLQQRYAEEAAKRIRADGPAQFLDLTDADTDRFKAIAEDPWADHAALNAKETVKDGATSKFLILGGGYGGLLFAVRLVQAGLIKGPDDVRLIDAAGGFGGTWYWNRYPGLHCDVESYIYMPLLEETGYMPKQKYSPGSELREHAERIATQFELHDKTLFRSNAKAATWDEEEKLWTVQVTEGRGPNEPSRELTLKCQYLLVASGVLNVPHVPKIHGLEGFGGEMFHTARWDYSATGGSYENPDMEKLKDKRVGIIGTGATSIQIIPQLAKWAKELYVFQRTPSAVHPRDQKATDPEEWKTKIASKKGWQMERALNFVAHMSLATKNGEENLVDDGWTKMPAYSALIGSPGYGLVEPTPEAIGANVARLYKMDTHTAETARARVDQIVKNPETANKLKAWYPSWCKRPTFSDMYLQAFNEPNVHLIDTNGQGIEAATKDGLVFVGKEYPLDVLVLSTGYRSPAFGNGNPAAKTGIEVIGRGGLSMDEKWKNIGSATLHGVATSGFPNLFFAFGPQTAGTANFVTMLEVGIQHTAHILAKAEEKVGAGSRAVVEVTREEEEAWTMQVMMRAPYFASIVGCTPGYLNGEGQSARQDPKDMMKASRSSGWSEGMLSYIEVLEEYRREGSLKGVEVTAA
ncbi:hypothetical protein QBC45DRAFT_412650 [Copromyces sp. CBS 386.78]|nr:hypothetical protein QBC45DRAFT_412650 [Copromyces sp. CBS 386.78]